MAARCLTRHVANHVTMSHLMSAVGCNVQLHTASTCLDSPEFQKRNAPGGSNIGALKTATPAATQHYHNGGTGGEVPQAEVLGRDLRHGLPARARTPMASAQGQQAQQQRRSLSDNAPRTGTQREHQSRGDFADRRGSRDRAARGAQDWRPTSNLLDVQSQRPSTTQGSSNFRGQPKVTGPAAGSRPAFIDRSGPRPAFVDRSQPGRGPRPAFIDRSGAAHRKDMPDQRQRSAWQTHQQGSQSQQGRPAPSNMRMPLPDVPDDDDSEQQAFDEPTRRTRARKAAPSSSFRTERTAPGSRAGGPARGAQANIPAAFDDDMDSELDREQQEGVSENFLERMQYNSRGVPASWKDTIQDAEDQDDLDEAREISAFNRLRHSGEVKFLEEELRNDLHTMEMNSDPRLEFGLETPLLHESDPLDAAHLLASAKDDMCQMLEIENDEEWQEVTEGLCEDFAELDQQLHEGLIKTKVREWGLQDMVEQSMPSTHPMYPKVSQSLQMLESNPNWPFARKVQFMQRLIKDLT